MLTRSDPFAPHSANAPAPSQRSRRMMAWILAFSIFLPLTASAQDALFVVGRVSPNLHEGDGIVNLQLELRGWNITVVEDDDVVAADANGMDLVIVSGTVMSGKVGNTFTATTIPVVTWESFIFDDMGMTGPVADVDHGTTFDEMELDIVGTHALTAGLSGTILMTTQIERITWGVPGPNAIVAVREFGSATRAAVFGYESGASMVVGTAPARRVGLFLGDTVSRSWTADTVDLFEHAVAWAIGDPPPDFARVLFIGDSITAGAKGQDSYRVELWPQFLADNCEIDFVGSYYGNDPIENNYDAHHESEGGLRTDEIEVQLPGNLQGNVPDYAAIHLGTNDVLQSASLTDAKENLRDIIGHLRFENPNVEIFLAKIIPNKSAFDADTLVLNGHIVDLAGEETTGASPISIVDHYNRYDPLALSLPDQIHPNNDGELEMANRWFAVMHPQLSSYCGGVSEEPPPPPPPPVPSISGMGLVATALLLGTTGLRAGRRQTRIRRPHTH